MPSDGAKAIAGLLRLGSVGMITLALILVCGAVLVVAAFFLFVLFPSPWTIGIILVGFVILAVSIAKGVKAKLRRLEQ